MKKVALVALVGVAFFVLQYLAISNTGIGVYLQISDTWPYSENHSYLPLPRAINLALYPVYRVLKLPLSSFIAAIGKRPGGHWSRQAFVFLQPFGSATDTAIKNNHLAGC